MNGVETAVQADDGTKVAPHYQLTIAGLGSAVIRLRLRPADQAGEPFGEEFARIFAQRKTEADEFYARKISQSLITDQQHVVRQAYAGLLWSKQFYHYVVKEWRARRSRDAPAAARARHTRNADWPQLYANDVLSMPDKWEYPWFAAWDLAFHMIPMARVDPHFAKEQLQLLLREWYMHPNGQMPAYEWNFSDVNPPVHAWACWRVYKISAPRGRARHASSSSAVFRSCC